MAAAVPVVVSEWTKVPVKARKTVQGGVDSHGGALEGRWGRIVGARSLTVGVEIGGGTFVTKPPLACAYCTRGDVDGLMS